MDSPTKHLTSYFKDFEPYLSESTTVLNQKYDELKRTIAAKKIRNHFLRMKDQIV